MKRPQLKLVADNAACDETVFHLTQLLRQAQAGQVIGLAFVAIQRDGAFFVDFSGRARAEPVSARGMVRSLDDDLGRLADENFDAAPSHTR